MIAKSEIVKIFESAFQPLQCVAELQNYEHAFGFRIYLPDGKYITHEEPDVSALLYEAQLAFLIHQYRDKLAQRGIEFHNWTPPNAKAS